MNAIDLVAGGGAGAPYAVLEVRARRGARVPPHVTSREDATLLVLEGALEIVFADERRVLGPGDVVQLHRGRPRRLAVLADVRLLCLAVPGDAAGLVDVIEPGGDPDDVAARLTVAGIRLLPRGWGDISR